MFEGSSGNDSSHTVSNKIDNDLFFSTHSNSLNGVDDLLSQFFAHEINVAIGVDLIAAGCEHFC